MMLRLLERLNTKACLWTSTAEWNVLGLNRNWWYLCLLNFYTIRTGESIRTCQKILHSPKGVSSFVVPIPFVLRRNFFAIIWESRTGCLDEKIQPKIPVIEFSMLGSSGVEPSLSQITPLKYFVICVSSRVMFDNHNLTNTASLIVSRILKMIVVCLRI